VIRKLILGLALAWAIAALLLETGRALAGFDDRGQSRDEVPSWRFGTPQAEELDRCLALVRRRVPAGRIVVFASPAGASETPETPQTLDHEFFRWRWAAYLLPRWEVAPLKDPTIRATADYVITWRRDLAIPRLALVAADPDVPGCRLYRVRKAGP
jgi:hypothetical protein